MSCVMMVGVLITDILMMAPEPVEPKFILASCPDCAEKSRQGSLKRYHVNLEESIVLCDNDLVSKKTWLLYLYLL